jgi:uncharacterized protein with PIN domain
LLTRDRELAQRRGVTVLFVTGETLDDQIRQVLAESHLEPGHSFSRCPVCNTSLQKIDLESARKRVPAYVAQTHKEFKSCPGCQRIYWRGTHRQKMDDQLSRLKP